jgi:hypothetical protein
MSEYKETSDEKHQRQGCMATLMGDVKNGIEKMKLNNVQYRVDAVGMNKDYDIRLAVEKPGNSGLKSGFIAVSMIGHIVQKSKGWGWFKRLEKSLILNIGINPKILPKISSDIVKEKSYDILTGLFKNQKKSFKNNLSANENFVNIEIEMNFHQIK